MFVLERLLDDLGKEAKEAPGWITLWTLCNVALYFIAELPIIGSIENEERAEKLVRNAMMVSAAVGFFLLFSKAWVAGGLAWVPWLLLWPLHSTLAAARDFRLCVGPPGSRMASHTLLRS